MAQGSLLDALAHLLVVLLVDHPPHLLPRLLAVVVVAVHYYQHNRLPRPGNPIPLLVLRLLCLMGLGVVLLFLLSRGVVGALPRHYHQVDPVDRPQLQQPWWLGLAEWFLLT